MRGNDDQYPGKEAKDDRRDAGQYHHRKAHRPGEAPPTKLGKVDAGAQAQRNAHDGGKAHQDKRSLHGFTHATARRAEGRRQLREEAHIEKRQPPHDDVEQQVDQDSHGKERSRNRQRQYEQVARSPPQHMRRARWQKRMGSSAHVFNPPMLMRPIRATSQRARTFVASVMRKTSRPASSSAERKSPCVASPNWLAMTLESV